MNYFSYMLLSLLIAGWSINPFLIKQSIGKLSQLQYLSLKLFFVTFIILLIYLLKLLFTSEKFTDIGKVFTKNQLYWFSASTFITIATSFLLITLLKYNNVTYIMPQIQPIIIMLTLLFGYLIFNETLKLQQLFGVLLIIIGIFFINYFK